jgi:hypothetical protein
MTPHPLYDWLALAVPLALGELAAQGGPTRRHWEAAQRWGVTLAEKGDQILYRDKETAALASTLARTLAVLAYAPGGVRFGPHHWEADAEQGGPP